MDVHIALFTIAFGDVHLGALPLAICDRGSMSGRDSDQRQI